MMYAAYNCTFAFLRTCHRCARICRKSIRRAEEYGETDSPKRSCSGQKTSSTLITLRIQTAVRNYWKKNTCLVGNSLFTRFVSFSRRFSCAREKTTGHFQQIANRTCRRAFVWTRATVFAVRQLTTSSDV